MEVAPIDALLIRTFKLHPPTSRRRPQHRSKFFPGKSALLAMPTSLRVRKVNTNSFHHNLIIISPLSVPMEQPPPPSSTSTLFMFGLSVIDCTLGSANTQPSPPLEIPMDSIKTEYHPHSGRPHRIEKFEDYTERNTTNTPSPPTNPWRPFQSKLDFEFAEVALEACLTKKQVEKLISIIQRCQTGEDQMNIGTHKQLRETWDEASSLLTPVSNIALVLPLYTKLNLYRDL